MKFAALLSLLLAAACAPARRGWEAGWSERAAKDRIMLVRQNPETLGHRRLVHQSAAHPELGDFLQGKGLPDFIAETSSDDRQYLILYYLDTRRAFACRTRRSPGTRTEFAGPYPMTDRETKLLRDLQRSSRGEG
jgi:hypothetical protein